MDMLRKHKVFDLTVKGYLTGLREVFPGDGVSAFSVWSMGRHGFGLDGDELEKFAMLAIKELLESGAVPAKPNAEGPDYFEPEIGYEGSLKETTERIVSEAKALGHDPDHGWHWFYRF